MFEDIKKKLSTVSPTMCLAKWTQSTINLANGETHSCHHPGRHKIPVEGLVDNPKMIHNTPIKMYARKDLLDGIQTPECDYCWRIENTNPDNASDRLLKSASSWSAPFFDDVINSGLGENYDPKYLEVMFEITCNFACVYCIPDVSSRILGDIESNGPYKLLNQVLHDYTHLKESGKLPIHRNDFNPYIEAFWKWWPELYPSLHTFRITGGEPLLSKHTWKVFDWIKVNPNKNLELAINTNLYVPDNLIDKMVSELGELEQNVKRISIFTSLEATGEHAEYIRRGLDYDQLISNIKKVQKQLPNVNICIMTTFNLLCVETIVDFFEKMLSLRKDSPSLKQFSISINYLRWPDIFDLRILPQHIKIKTEKAIIDLIDREKSNFNMLELDQLNRLVKYMMLESHNSQALVDDLRAFLKQSDLRYGTDFDSTFKNTELLAWANK